MSDRVRLERVWDAPLADVWELWTTPEGLESWWGPDGFYVTVHELDLRPGGALDYTMTARGEAQIAFLTGAGMPISTRHRARYTEVVPRALLVYEHRVDFLPGQPPYDVTHRVELREVDGGVQMILEFDRMHAEEVTRRAALGWEQELGKLAGALVARR